MGEGYQEKDVNGKKVKVKKLTIDEVSEAVEETVEGGNTLHMSHRVYSLPVAFLRRSIDGFGDYGYEDLPRLVEVFREVNPTADQDQKTVIVILDQPSSTGEVGSET